MKNKIIILGILVNMIIGSTVSLAADQYTITCQPVSLQTDNGVGVYVDFVEGNPYSGTPLNAKPLKIGSAVPHVLYRLQGTPEHEAGTLQIQSLKIKKATLIAKLVDRKIYGVALEIPSDSKLQAGDQQTSNSQHTVYTTCTETKY